MSEVLDPMPGVTFDPDTTCTTGDDWNLSASEVNKLVRKLAEFPMDEESFKECVLASRKNLRHHDGRIVNGAVANMVKMAKNNSDKVRMIQQGALAREARKVEVDHNVSGAVVLMPPKDDGSDTLPPADLTVIDAYEAQSDGDGDS